MASAPTLTPRQLSHSLKGSRWTPKTIKSSIRNPFGFEWPSVNRSLSAEIIAKLEERLATVGDARRSVAAATRAKHARHLEELKRLRGRKRAEARRAVRAARAVGTAGCEVARPVVGVNAVMRGVERDALRVVVVDACVPGLLARGLLVLCATRRCRAIVLDGLGDAMRRALAISSCLAIGFRRDSAAHDDVAAFVEERAPPLHVPWLTPDVVDSGAATEKVAAAATGKGAATEKAAAAATGKVAATGKAAAAAVAKDARPLGSYRHDYSHLYVRVGEDGASQGSRAPDATAATTTDGNSSPKRKSGDVNDGEKQTKRQKVVEQTQKRKKRTQMKKERKGKQEMYIPVDMNMAVFRGDKKNKKKPTRYTLASAVKKRKQAEKQAKKLQQLK